MHLSIVVAVSENNVIGKDNKIPWHLPNDLRFFKNTTWGLPVIMGRKTFDSIQNPLPGRTNIVITRQTGWQREGVRVAKSLKEAIDAAAHTDAKEAFIIGGAEIFTDSFPVADKVYLTRIHANIEGNTFLTGFREEDWMLKSRLDFEVDDRHKYPYSFLVYERPSPE